MSTARKFFLRFWPYLALIAAVFLVYSNVYDNQFLFDDEFLIQKNRFLRSWLEIGNIFAGPSTAGSGGVDSFYRPMQGFLYLLVFQIFGLSTFGFHLLNVSIHAANAGLIYRLGEKLKLRGAFFAALLWAVHPMHTEAVTYQSATADGLYTFFILLGAILLLPSFSWKKIAIASGVFILGLLSKESAIVFPVIAMVLIYYVSERRWHWREYLKTLPLWLIAGLYFILRQTILNFADTFHFYKISNIYTENILYRTYTFLATLPSYMELLINPHDLHMERDFPVYIDWMFTPVVIGIVLVVLAIGLLAWSRGRRAKDFEFSILWYFSAQIPHMGILLPVNSLFLEHWMYLASSGFLLGIVSGVARIRSLSKFKIPAMVATVLLAGFWGYLTFQQNETWSDPVTFYNYILKYEKGTQRVHNNLAMAYATQGEVSKAIEHYETSIAMGDIYPQTQNNLGLVLIGNGRTGEGIVHLKRAVEIDPEFYHAYRILAEVYSKLGNKQQADEYRAKYEETKKHFGL